MDTVQRQTLDRIRYRLQQARGLVQVSPTMGSWYDEVLADCTGLAMYGEGYEQMTLVEAVRAGKEDILDVDLEQLAPAKPIDGLIHMTALGERGGMDPVYAR